MRSGNEAPPRGCGVSETNIQCGAAREQTRLRMVPRKFERSCPDAERAAGSLSISSGTHWWIRQEVAPHCTWNINHSRVCEAREGFKVLIHHSSVDKLNSDL